MNQDANWKHRFDHYRRALTTLHEAVALAEKRPLSELEQLGLIHGFDYTYDLALNMLQGFLQYQGVFGLAGPRDTINAALANELISDSSPWIHMVSDRALSSESYYLGVANRIASDIITRFRPAFAALAEKFEGRVAMQTLSQHGG